MTAALTIGQVLGAQARLQPDRIAVRDLERRLTYHQWNARACQLANALLGLGLNHGDRVAVLAATAVALRRRRAGAAPPRRAAADGAARRLRAALRHEGDGADELLDPVAEFLASRLGCEPAAILGHDLTRRLAAGGVEQPLAERAAAAVDELVHARYGGAARAPDRAALARLFEELEAALPPR